MDFPNERLHKRVISSFSPEALGVAWGSLGGVAPTSAAWAPGANVGVFVPFTIWSPYLVRRVWWANGDSGITGSIDCGVYTANGPTRLLSCGPTVQATATVIQSVALATAVLLTPGSYYMTLVCSSGSTPIYRSAATATAMNRIAGLGQQAAVGTLPATATIAAIAQTDLPLFGISKASVL